MDTGCKKNIKSEKLPEVLAETLREQIISGKILPGQRIPNFDKLASEYSLGRCTVKVAIKELQTDGFLKASVRIGTFVESRLPNQRRYGLVIREHDGLNHKRNSLSHMALLRAVDYMNKNKTDDIEIVVYHISEDVIRHKRKDYDQLLIDVKHRTLGGLIISDWSNQDFRQVVKASKIPVVLTIPSEYSDVDLSNVLCFMRYDHAGMITTAIQQLAENGIKRAALIDYRFARERINDFKDEKYGLECHPDWCLNTHDSFEQAEVYVNLFFQGHPHPEAIIVGDDHLIKFVVRAINNLNLPKGKKPELYSFCNYPVIPQVDYPVTFIGINAYTFMENAMNLLTKKCVPPKNKNIIIKNQIFSDFNLNKDKTAHAICEYDEACYLNAKNNEQAALAI